MLDAARVPRLASSILALVALACGGAGASSSPAASSATERATANAGDEAAVTACAPERSPLRYEILDLPASIVVGPGSHGECSLLPRGADDATVAFVVELRAQERPLDAAVRTLEEHVGDDEPIVARGEVTLLGAPTRWLALGGELPVVGAGEARYAVVELTRHTLFVQVLFAASTPEAVRAEVMDVLSRMRTSGTERATDAWRHDPARAVCEADGIPLVVPVPEGSVRHASYETQCMIGPPAERPDDLAWSMWIGSVELGSEWGAVLAPEPGGTRAWAEGAFEDARVVEESTVSFLGATTPLVTVHGDDDQGRPRRFAVARARHGDRFVIAIVTTARDDLAHRVELVEALRGVRAP